MKGHVLPDHNREIIFTPSDTSCHSRMLQHILSYNILLYYSTMLWCGILELAIKGKYQITEQEIKLTNAILSYTTIV
ncbi:hypothetical protein DRF13_24010 [Salmonella enterica subsp. enterica serovar Corvallis]|nr:hypothetical protein [Salmonella enterica subsp. enterica serovar Corvallis]